MGSPIKYTPTWEHINEMVGGEGLEEEVLVFMAAERP